MQAHTVGRLLLCALCVLPGCSGDIDRDLTGPGEGALEIITSTTGVPEDPDGYAVTVDHGGARVLAPNGAKTVVELSPGPHTVELTGIVGFCVLDGENPRTIEVAAGDTASVRFDVACHTPVFEVSLSTTGFELDDDGYEVSIDDAAWGWALPDDTIRIANLSSGPHTVALTRVAPNCAVSGEHPRTINVVESAGTAHLDVVCHFAVTLGAYVETNGGDSDPDGYVARLNGASPVGVVGGPGSFNGGWFLPPGDYTVTLADVAPHCRLSGSNTATATVTAGASTRVSFTVSCGAMVPKPFGRDLLVDANTEINLVSPDGSRFVNLTNHPDLEFSATWSPDGRQIAFSSLHEVVEIPGPIGGRSHLESHVFTMNPDGSGRTQLTDGYREERTRLVAGRRQACLHRQRSRRYFAPLRHECRREWADPAGEPLRGTCLVPGWDQDRLFGTFWTARDLRDQRGWQRGDPTDRRHRRRCGLVSGRDQDRVRAVTGTGQRCLYDQRRWQWARPRRGHE